MYMEHTAEDHRQHIGLDPEYEVEAILAYGTWDLHTEETQLPHLHSALIATGHEYTLDRITKPILGHAYELRMQGKLYWFIPVMGTAVMANYLHLGTLFGSKRNILLGIVGGLAPGMMTGDLIVPTLIMGNDNARLYDRANSTNLYRPDDTLVGELTESLEGASRVRPIWYGTTTTCEMMLAETREDVVTWSEAGIKAVEMEGAVTFALSKRFGVPAVALFYVADNLIENETMLSDAHKEQHSAQEESRALQYKLGLQLLLG